ncbi:MAG TPA: hypothetical protein VFU23_15770, partial [Gemmatimonadales bacterium]|nr:hypothetical protein [Gemmatimonadales bacterium]
RAPAPPAEFDVEWLGSTGASAAYQFSPGPADTLVRFRVTRVRGTLPVALTLVGSTGWLSAPSTVRVSRAVDTITLVQHPPRLPGAYSASVRAEAAGVSGPLFILVSTVVVPAVARVGPVRSGGMLGAGHLRRVFFPADSGRPFRVRIATVSAREHLTAALHQPGGAPILGDNGIPGSADSAAAVFDVEARDALPGFYEADAVASSDRPVTASIQVDPSPLGVLLAGGPGDSIAITLRSFVDSTVSGRLDLGVIGGERRFDVSATGSDDLAIPFRLPGWARRLVVDLELDPAQWSRFTDLGFTARDAVGRILGKSPANYARARLTADLPAGASDQDATIVLAPAFAEPGSRERWSARVTLRVEAARPNAIATEGGDEFTLPAGRSRVLRGRLGDFPWSLPAGFEPLTILIAESGGISWGWRIPLAGVPKG